mgnify:FL=1
MQNVLIVSSGEKAKVFFDEMLKETEYGAKAYAYSCGEARRLLIERSFDLCVINAPLSDESGEKFATQIIGDKADQVILIVKSEFAEEVTSKVEDYGVFVLAKPFTRQSFFMVYKMAEAAYRRLNGVKAENDKLKRMLGEIKLISRAKCVLVEKEFVTEEEAHKLIEKRAMETRKTRGEIAAEILKKNE